MYDLNIQICKFPESGYEINAVLKCVKCQCYFSSNFRVKVDEIYFDNWYQAKNVIEKVPVGEKRKSLEDRKF